MMRLLFVIMLTSLSSFCYAQFFNKVDWRLNRHQLELGLGATNFLGELGGKDAIGTNDFRDLEFEETNFAITFGYKYTLYKKIHLRADFTYGTLSGNDNLTEEPFRQNRNLHFRSRIFELAALLEFEFPIRLKKGHIYDIKGVQGWRNGGSSFYAFVGIAGLHFNPQAQFDGQWIDLKPLRTEGQGLPGGADEYRRIALVIPFGCSLSRRITPRFALSLEATYRYAFTDYIDDVSTSYYNPYELQLYVDDGYEEIAAYLSNPSLNAQQGGLYPRVTAPGQQRGDETDRDGYMFLFLKGQYLLERNNAASTKYKKHQRRKKRKGKRVIF